MPGICSPKIGSMAKVKNTSVIPRYPEYQRLIVRERTPAKPFREENEVLAAYEQVGNIPDRSTTSWTPGLLDPYYRNEC